MALEVTAQSYCGGVSGCSLQILGSLQKSNVGVGNLNPGSEVLSGDEGVCKSKRAARTGCSLKLVMSVQIIVKTTERGGGGVGLRSVLFLDSVAGVAKGQVKDMRDKGFDPYSIGGSVKEIKNPKFANKYINQAAKFSMKEIADCMADCVDLTLKSRTGALTDRMAVELIIVKYSQRNKAK